MRQLISSDLQVDSLKAVAFPTPPTMRNEVRSAVLSAASGVKSKVLKTQPVMQVARQVRESARHPAHSLALNAAANYMGGV